MDRCKKIRGGKLMQILTRKMIRNRLRKLYGNKKLSYVFKRYQDTAGRGVNWNKRGLS